MATIKEKIALAALLHDIGKFWQRADDKMSKSKNLESQWYESFDWLVPNNQFDRPGYQHAFWTFAFIKKHKAVFAKIGINDIESFAKLAANHHRPDKNSIEQSIISMADKWASKNERVFADYAKTEDEEDTEEYKGWGQYAYKKMPLHSIFDLIKRTKLKESTKTVFDFQPLDVIDEVNIFASKNIIYGDRQEDYHNLWIQFSEEFEKLTNKCSNYIQLFVSIQALMKKYTWCIPSSTMDMPYASLYEHSKIVSGISLALYDAYEDESTNFNVENYGKFGAQIQLVEGSKDPLLMVCIDLSGIQKYIYNISSSGAAKALKGRSYNLQLVMKSLLNEILYDEEINAQPSSVIYESGGKAYLLLGNTEKVKKALNNLQKSLEEKFWNQYHGLLFPAIGWVSFRYQIKYKEGDIGYNLNLYSYHQELNNGSITLGDLWRVTSDEASKRKGEKFKSIVLKDDFFTPIPYEIGSTLCDVTGIQIKAEDAKRVKKSFVSEEVNEQINLGSKLKKATSISEAIFLENVENAIRPANLDTTYKLNAKINNLTVQWKYNDTKLGDAHGFLFYGGNEQPQNNNRGLSFEEISTTAYGNRTKLGVLKMDVDNLGQIFIKGLPDEDKSFSAYATLSFYLEAFFSGFINHIRNEDTFKDTVQIIYSGGDDVFAIGRWDKLIDFSIEVNRQFHAFTNRDDITISAGLVIVDPKFPIAKAADLADVAEKQSKSFTNKEGEIIKNAFTFFGQTVSWDGELKFIVEMKDKFFKSGLPSGLWHKLQAFKLQKDEGKDFSYKWLSAYSLSRTMERYSKEENKKDLLKEIRDNILQNRQFGANRYLDLIALAARWTEYLLKLKK